MPRWRARPPPIMSPSDSKDFQSVSASWRTAFPLVASSTISTRGPWLKRCGRGGQFHEGDDAMPVTGIGGLFFRSQDPDALKRWYCEHLGVGCGDYGMWEQQAGTTVFSPF